MCIVSQGFPVGGSPVALQGYVVWAVPHFLAAFPSLSHVPTPLPVPPVVPNKCPAHQSLSQVLLPQEILEDSGVTQLAQWLAKTRHMAGASCGGQHGISRECTMSGLRPWRGHLLAVILGKFHVCLEPQFTHGDKNPHRVFLNLDETHRWRPAHSGLSVHSSYGDAMWKALELRLPTALPTWQVSSP